MSKRPQRLRRIDRRIKNKIENQRHHVEHPAERASRLRREEDNARAKRRERLALVGLMIFFAMMGAIVFVVTILSERYRYEERVLAVNLLVSIITGVAGYWAGKK